MEDKPQVEDATPVAQVAPKSTFQKALPFLAVAGAVAVVGGIAAGVALSQQESNDGTRELNQLTLLNTCKGLDGSDVSKEPGVQGVAACFGEQAGVCDFSVTEPVVQLFNCSATQKVCRCGFGKVYKKKVGVDICGDQEDDDDAEICDEISDAEDEFSDSEDDSDSEDEIGLERLNEFLQQCSESSEDFFTCLNDELRFSCLEGVGAVFDCDNRVTDKCDGAEGEVFSEDPCVVDEDTESDSESSDSSDSDSDNDNSTDVVV